MSKFAEAGSSILLPPGLLDSGIPMTQSETEHRGEENTEMEREPSRHLRGLAMTAFRVPVFLLLFLCLFAPSAWAGGVTTIEALDVYTPLSISADGRYLAFAAKCATTSYSCVYVRDRRDSVTTLASVSSVGVSGDSGSWNPSISADGRYVAFVSKATNLVAGDTNGFSDIYVHDRQTGETTRVSVDSDGTQGDDESSMPAISANGHSVAFVSTATNLVAGDTNGVDDVFVRDMVFNTTTRVSVASDGTQGNGSSYSPSISADGRYVAFRSDAYNNLVAGVDTSYRIYVHDRQTGETTHVSVDSAGIQANADSSNPSISADGRYVALVSNATNLVAGDTNGFSDIYVHDRQTGETTRVSVASDGTQGNSVSYAPQISGDGRYVAFESWASNLVPGDTNTSGDIFVHDRLMDETMCVSVASDGTQGNSRSFGLSMSADGRYVAFSSESTNLVVGDPEVTWDLYVHDRGVPPTNVATTTTGTASSITQTGATLNATANDNGLPTKVKFEYGLTTAYGAMITAAQSPVTGSITTPVSASVTGLTCATTYHFRVVGINQAGLTNGADATFVTSACGSLTVNILPAGLAGAQWSVDGGAWQASGATVSTLVDGSHIVSFNTLIGYKSPANQNVTITDGQTTTATGTYTAVTGVTAPIAAGGNHTVALKNDGTVWEWGGNYYGQLGNGTTTDSHTSAQVTGLTGVTAVSAGDAHSVAMKNDGTVWAWGYNYHGQLGDGTTDTRLNPVQVTGLTGVYAIAAGDSYTIALKNDGTVWAWGWNGTGALGDGTTTQRLTPVQVTGLTGVTSIAAAYGHTVALKGDGTVWAWGGNSSGQLGDGTTTRRLTPVQVTGLTGVTAIAAASGGYHDYTVALKNDGTVWAWGNNETGALGNGTTTDSPTPMQVTGLTGVTSIATGYGHTVALKGDGTVWAWGNNDSGQLGNGTTSYSGNPIPSQVAGLTGIYAIAAGDAHSVAMKNDGTVWAWGYNSFGQLGDGTTTDSLTPVQVSEFTNTGTLTDAVLALQVIAGISPQQIVYKEADVNGDVKIGLADVLYILQKAAGKR